MLLTSIDSKLCHNAIIQGCQEIIKARENLNEINIFPVADGDTGDNMAATASAIMQFSHIKLSLNETLQSIADASIQGARGNSGMIFSQFFNGLIEKSIETNTINTQTFANLVHTSCLSVRQAIGNPVEGTILTVMDAWANSLMEHAAQISCFNALLKAVHPTIEAALAKTATTLAVLKSAHVVDAGALGFVRFVSGIKAFWLNPTVISLKEHSICDTHTHTLPDAGDPPTLRYCTEAILTGNHLDSHALSTQLQTFGDSVVITANTSLCRFHVHTNTPSQVFDALRTQGLLQQPKIDDMLRQYQSLHHPKYPIALVTDSSADISKAFLDEHQIHLIPLNIHFDGHHLLDKYCLNQDTVYDELAHLKTHPTTSFPAPGLIENKLCHIAQTYPHVLVITIAQILSGTHDAFVNAAKKYDNVTVINSKVTTGAEGLLVMKAAKLIQQGLSFDALCQEINQDIPKTKLFIIVNQMDSLIRSGRVSKLKGRIAKLSGVKPILTLDKEGRAIIFDKAFSERKAIDKVIQTILTIKNTQGLQDYAIIHAGVPEKAKSLAASVTNSLGQAPVFIEPVSTVLGLHAGKGALAIALMTE